MWRRFPAKERGTASAIFNAAQYFSLALFSPLLGWLTFALGWEHVFTVMGIIGFVLTIIWVKFVHNPTDHPRMSAAELKYISEGGAVVDMDHKRGHPAAGPKMDYIRQLLTNRMMLGVFFGQYFLNTITWFFLTWFPIYLVQDKGMSILKVGFVASIPALFGFAGGVLGGLFSDYLIGRGCTLTFARKLPIVLGMLLASSIILCNYGQHAAGHYADGAGVLWQRLWRAGLAGYLGCRAEGDCWPVRRGIQRLWQCGLDRHAAGYWLHRERTALI